MHSHCRIRWKNPFPFAARADHTKKNKRDASSSHDGIRFAVGGSTASASPPYGSAPPPASGRYRVTINGIHVNGETWDTALQTDGKGDEIFVLVDLRYLNAGGNPVGPSTQITTAIYGDTNGFPSRIKAGTRSPQGGIRTGDNIPDGSAPWARFGLPQPSRLPLFVWEGTLTDGRDGVLIVPAIWEQDSTDRFVAPFNQVAGAIGSVASVAGSTLKPLWDLWNSGVVDTAAFNAFVFGITGPAGLSPTFSIVMNKFPKDVNRQALDGLGTAANWLGAEITKIVGESRDRPVGMVEYGGKYVFNPHMITLNYRTAEEASRRIVPNRGVGNNDGGGLARAI